MFSSSCHKKLPDNAKSETRCKTEENFSHLRHISYEIVRYPVLFKTTYQSHCFQKNVNISAYTSVAELSVSNFRIE